MDDAARLWRDGSSTMVGRALGLSIIARV